MAIRMGDVKQLAEKLNTQVIPADVTKVADIEAVYKGAMEQFGGSFDFLLHSVGMSPNVRKKVPYDQIDYNKFAMTMDISAMSFHKMIQTAKKMEAIAEWGSIVGLSYIAAQRTLFEYNDMADAKAMLESIARSFGYIYGREKHVRINTISQSPTPTTAGKGVKGFDGLMDFTERMSPLGNATAEDLANYCITLFSDLTRKVTMQNLYHDGGFSSMGMSRRAMHMYNRSLEMNRDENKE
jgi:enoyl-[acyl-carrier protein] reductase I